MICTRVWLDAKDHSVEGHTKDCVLFFKGKEIWGPEHCHPNTQELADALSKADCRFYLKLTDRDHSVEGHRA